jgi:hypothetical protein
MAGAAGGLLSEHPETSAELSAMVPINAERVVRCGVEMCDMMIAPWVIFALLYTFTDVCK